MFRYRLHSPDGDDLGEATYAQMIYPDEEIIAGGNQHFRVLDVVPIDDEESPFVGLLQVEASSDAPHVRDFGPIARSCTGSVPAPCPNAHPGT